MGGYANRLTAGYANVGACSSSARHAVQGRHPLSGPCLHAGDLGAAVGQHVDLAVGNAADLRGGKADGKVAGENLRQHA